MFLYRRPVDKRIHSEGLDRYGALVAFTPWTSQSATFEPRIPWGFR
jgi:hypothetical protein